MKKLIFEKSITRDWSLLYTEIWHRVFMKECYKQLGWRLSNAIYEGHDNSVTAYRSHSELTDGLRKFIFSKLKKNKNWLKTLTTNVKQKVEQTIEWMKKMTFRPEIWL